MKINLFDKMLGEDHDKQYAVLTQREKYIVDLLGVLALSDRPDRIEEITIDQEVLVDKETNRFSARYIIEVPIGTNKH